jgi:hypothetical protein
LDGVARRLESVDIIHIPINEPGEFEPLTSGAYRLQVPRENVIIVDSSDFIPQIQFGMVAGVDAEWRPTLHKYEQTTLSIIQIATRDVVYIFDMLALAGDAKIDELLTEFFQNEDIKKCGIGLKNDVKVFQKSLPKSTKFCNDTRGIVDT